MKIRVNSLLPLEVPKHLEDLDISMGFSYYEGKYGKNNHLTTQAYNILKKFLGFKNIDLTQDDMHFIGNIGEAVKFTLDTFKTNSISKNLQDSLSLQINTQRGDQYLNKIINNRFRNIENNSKLAQVDHSNGHKVMLGVNFVYDKNNKILPHIKNQVGTDNFMEFIYFHELGHVIEHEYSPQLKNIVYNVKTLKEEQHLMSQKQPIGVTATRQLFDSLLSNLSTDELLDPNVIMIQNSNILWKEIYADTMGLLLHQNYCLERNKITDIKNFTDVIIKAREEELFEKTPKKSSSLMQTYTGHYTSIGLLSLKDLLPEIANKSLDLDKINELATYCANQGVHKYLYTLIESHPLTIGGIVWSYNSAAKENPKLERITIDQLKTQIVSEIEGNWVEDFQKNKEKLKQSKLSSEYNPYYISLIGLTPNKFTECLEKSMDVPIINKNHFLNKIIKVREDNTIQSNTDLKLTK